jgi:signal transduction histidine kinase
MRIGQKIILYFTSVPITLIGLFFIFIYTLFAEYRRTEFHQRLRDNTITTLRFLAEAEKKDRNMLESLDRFTINNLYHEKVMLFDENKKLIYSGIDDTEILASEKILAKLSDKTPEVEMQEEEFDVVGAFLPYENKRFYGIVKAYDLFGHSKLDYLRNVLVVSFVLLAAIVFLITFYLSRQISRPLKRMAFEIANVRLDSDNSNISIPDTRDEINYLGQQFNLLMSNLKEAFAFQKHAIHHISHELKTPIAILVSNFEKMEAEEDVQKLRNYLRIQKEDTHNLSSIINALLEISKAESGNKIVMQDKVRIDDMLYDLISEIKSINADFVFEVLVDSSIDDERKLTVTGNKRLLTSAFTNLIMNCINYSSESSAIISMHAQDDKLYIIFRNLGAIINESEKQFVFQHFFRGSNSKGIRGFGLGLVLIHKIIQLHDGTIDYASEGNNINVFTAVLPLS